MIARYSEEYYKRNWDKLIQETKDADYINLEDELEYRMQIYKELPQEAYKAVEKIEAKKIIDKTNATLKERMKVISSLETGKSDLGYASQMRKVTEMGRIIERFEFNCYQLLVFKKTHS